MGIFSFVGGIVSGIGSAISSAVGAIGSALSSFASGVGAVIGTIIQALPELGKALGQFASNLLQALGILKPDEKIEDIGERALQMKEKEKLTIDDFDDFDAYMDALRNFELDPDKASKRNPAEKITAGLGVGTVAMERKFNAEPGAYNGLWLLPIVNPTYFTPERVQNLVTTGQFVGDVWAYLEKRLDASDSRRVEESLVAGLTRGSSDTDSKAAAYEALDAARDGYAKTIESLNKQGAHA
jgi:hypothetical protein